MDMETYNKRAIPRLRQIEEMDKRCQWNKWDFELPLNIQELRKRREKLMDEQVQDEIAAGL